jgi:hypothetical protein
MLYLVEGTHIKGYIQGIISMQMRHYMAEELHSILCQMGCTFTRSYNICDSLGRIDEGVNTHILGQL